MAVAKKRKCAVKTCGKLFEQRNSFHVVCSPSCGVIKHKIELLTLAAKKERDFKAQTLKMKKEMRDNDSSWWSDKAQKACNEFIKFRDLGKPCISCGTMKSHLRYDSGHFIPVGRSAALRFEVTNIARQCANNCNVKLSGNCLEYRKALVIKYGAAHVEWLEGSHEMPRYRIEDYKRIYAEFKAKTKLLKAISQ